MAISAHETASRENAGSRQNWRDSLSFRLLWLTIGVILLVEAVIFIPSAANFRKTWLNDQVQAAQMVSLTLEAAPMREVSGGLWEELLARAQMLAVTERVDGMRVQLLAMQGPVPRPVKQIDLRNESWLRGTLRTLSSLVSSGKRTLLIIGDGPRDGRVLEVLVPEAPLTLALQNYCMRIIGLSLLISLAAGLLVFAVLFCLVVEPMKRVTAAAEAFRDNPGQPGPGLASTTRRDEIGRAQNALADMQQVVSESFRQRERLADLGEAVARINHDLRGSLAAAQLVSDTLSRSEDPRVARALPRLERALERATNLATQTLQYGKASAPAPDLRACALRAIVAEAADEALSQAREIDWHNNVPEAQYVHADPDHLHRIVANLVRNASEAMGKTGEIRAQLEGTTLVIADTGPGLPDTLRENLFKPFSSGGRKSGTGLGLAIARDLARGMGGDLVLRNTGPDGTAFAVTLVPSAE